MKCPKCGTRIADNCRICPACKAHVNNDENFSVDSDRESRRVSTKTGRPALFWLAPALCVLAGVAVFMKWFTINGTVDMRSIFEMASSASFSDNGVIAALAVGTVIAFALIVAAAVITVAHLSRPAGLFSAALLTAVGVYGIAVVVLTYTSIDSYYTSFTIRPTVWQFALIAGALGAAVINAWAGTEYSRRREAVAKAERAAAAARKKTAATKAAAEAQRKKHSVTVEKKVSDRARLVDEINDGVDRRRDK